MGISQLPGWVMLWRSRNIQRWREERTFSLVQNIMTSFISILIILQGDVIQNWKINKKCFLKLEKQQNKKIQQDYKLTRMKERHSQIKSLHTAMHAEDLWFLYRVTTTTRVDTNIYVCCSGGSQRQRRGGGRSGITAIQTVSVRRFSMSNLE